MLIDTVKMMLKIPSCRNIFSVYTVILTRKFDRLVIFTHPNICSISKILCICQHLNTFRLKQFSNK